MHRLLEFSEGPGDTVNPAGNQANQRLSEPGLVRKITAARAEACKTIYKHQRRSALALGYMLRLDCLADVVLHDLTSRFPDLAPAFHLVACAALAVGSLRWMRDHSREPLR